MLLPGLYVAVGLRGAWWMAGLRQKDQQGRKGECMRLGLRAEVPEPKGQRGEPVSFADGELSWARVLCFFSYILSFLGVYPGECLQSDGS